VGEAFRDDARVVEENAFIELVPWRAGLADVYQIIVTTRDREAMPLLRYQTGDIVQKRKDGFRLLGREGNLYLRTDGSLVSVENIDAALPSDFACWHYSLIQSNDSRWDFHYVADHVAPGGVEEALSRVLGSGIRVSAFRRRVIAPAASGKFSLLKPLARA
jgi:phenylacetate-CoA ligase